VLGWIETVVKLAAIAVAVVTAASGGRWHVPRTHAPAFWMITAISIGYFGTVIDCWLDKEVVAMVFVVLMLSGHWSLVCAMGGPTWPRAAVLVGEVAAGAERGDACTGTATDVGWDGVFGGVFGGVVVDGTSPSTEMSVASRPQLRSSVERRRSRLTTTCMAGGHDGHAFRHGRAEPENADSARFDGYYPLAPSMTTKPAGRVS
jgi:hypothetical protein